MFQFCYYSQPFQRIRPGRYSISMSRGLSSSSDTYLPFFFRCRTHSVRRYSICPFTERKSSSAQAAIWLYSFVERRSGICFFLVICHRLISCLISTGCLNLPQAGRHGFRREPPEGWIPWRPYARRPAPPYASHQGAPAPSPPCRRLLPRSSFWHL